MEYMLGFEFPELSTHEFKIAIPGIEQLAHHHAPPITPGFLSTLVLCGVDFNPLHITYSYTFLFASITFARISNLFPEPSKASHIQAYKRISCYLFR